MVDSLHILRSKHLELSLGDCEIMTALADHLPDLGIGHFAAYQLVNIYGHAYRVIETLHCLYATYGGSLRICKVILHAHHVYGKAHKTAHVALIYVTRPTGPDCLPT